VGAAVAFGTEAVCFDVVVDLPVDAGWDALFMCVRERPGAEYFDSRASQKRLEKTVV